LKILFVLGFPNPFPGAAWTRIGFLADAWSKKGHSIEVLGAFTYKSFQKRGVAESGKAKIFNLVFHIDLDHPLIFAINSLMSFIVSTLILISRKPNVALVSVPPGDVGVGALMACQLTRTKSIVDYRDDWEDYMILCSRSPVAKTLNKATKRIAMLIYTKTDLVIPVSPLDVATLKSAGVHKVHLIPNGADVKIFRPYEKMKPRSQMGLAADCFIVVFTGALEGYYMLNETMCAFAEFLKTPKHASAKLLLINNQEKNEKLTNEITCVARELGIDNSVLCLSGTCDHSKLAKMIALADVGLIPLDKQRGHRWPAKFFEYCACGLPVIATVKADSILGKLIHAYDLGLTVPPNDYLQLANALTRICEDSEFRSRAKRRARRMVLQNFDRNKLEEEFLELLKMNVHGKASFN